MKKINKQFLVSLVLAILSIISFVFLQNIPYKMICKGDLFYIFNNNYDLLLKCGEVVKFIKITFLMLPLVFLFSILFYFKKSNFELWFKYTKFFLIVYFIILSIVPWYVGDAYLNIQKIHYVYIFMIIYI
jgi:hypothetical protein